jgi:uncharacterized protein (DUF1015 family)
LKRREAAAAAGMRDDEIRSAEFNYFLSVLFPDEELKIMDYNRVVRDLNAYTPDDFLEAVSDKFEVQMTSLSCHEKDADALMRPREKYEIGMYLNGRSYLLRLKETYRNAVKDDPVQSLDVSVLQNEVLAPLLGIGDPRTDKRIRFIGGIRGLGELVRDADRYTSEQDPVSKAAGPAVAFAMYPTDIRELFRVADAGLLMPPKSTWFEPKLRSGLFIHEFERIGT